MSTLSLYFEIGFKSICKLIFNGGQEHQLAINKTDAPESLKISSTAFETGQLLPWKYAGNRVTGGRDLSPPFEIDGSTIPKGTKSLAIVVQDLDVPIWKPITHGLFYNIDPKTINFPEGYLNQTPEEAGFHAGSNAMWSTYIGPSPLVDDPPHRYYFQVFALDTDEQLETKISLETLYPYLIKHTIAKGKIIGTFQRTWEKH